MRINTSSLLIVTLVLSAIVILSGCESGQLKDCQSENIILSAEINELKETATNQNTELESLRTSLSEYSQLVVDMTALLESGKAEIERLRREVEQLKKQ